MAVSSLLAHSNPVGRIASRILGRGDKAQCATMQRNDVDINASVSSSRSSTTLTYSKPGVIDPFETTGHVGIKVVSDPSKAEFDIWFVHGLTGNRIKTWTHENGTFWPSLLAQDFPHARVIVYGYDADIAKFAKKWQNASSEGLHSYGQGLAFAIRNSRQGDVPVPATRPIYFIPHSLGGLVVEQALLICIGPDQSLNDIATAAAGILFMGTPHEGSHLARWGSTLLKLVPERIWSTNKKALEALNRESETCKNLEELFQTESKHGKFAKIKLFSFYETIIMTGFSKVVVPERSAVLRADFKCPIHGTHTSMTRFDGPKDDGYCKVKGQLMAWVLPTRQAAQANPEKERKKKKKKIRRRRNSSISTIGPTFSGAISGGTINANQMSVSGNMHVQYGEKSQQRHYYGVERLETEDESSDKEEESKDSSGNWHEMQLKAHEEID